MNGRIFNHTPGPRRSGDELLVRIAVKVMRELRRTLRGPDDKGCLPALGGGDEQIPVLKPQLHELACAVFGVVFKVLDGLDQRQIPARHEGHHTLCIRHRQHAHAAEDLNAERQPTCGAAAAEKDTPPRCKGGGDGPRQIGQRGGLGGKLPQGMHIHLMHQLHRLPHIRTRHLGERGGERVLRFRVQRPELVVGCNLEKLIGSIHALKNSTVAAGRMFTSVSFPSCTLRGAFHYACKLA